MASANQPETQGRQPITQAARRRLQQCFEHASKSAAKGDFDYAADMLTQCVLGDPANLIYFQQFLGNLYRKYGNNKKGSKLAGLSGMGIKTSIKKASMTKDWPGVIKSGLEMLKLNPWDVSTLLAVATACSELQYEETQLALIRCALEVNVKDTDVNRTCGKLLANLGQFDQAIACWQRVVQARPTDQEAQRAVSDLTVNRTISKGKYDSTDARVGALAQSAKSEAGVATAERDQPERLTREQQLERLIARQPEELAHYLELSDLHLRDDQFEKAEAVLRKALEASGGDMMIRERLEDTQLRRGQRQLALAEQREKADKSPETSELVKRLRAECNRLELDVYRSRSDRHPTNLSLKFDLGVRLKRAGQYNEAIQALQLARGDVKRKAAVHLELGECFQYIKQFKLAMSNYEAAIEAVGTREPDLRKLSLYRAGVLALGLKEIDAAEKYLNNLASLEFGYRDVPERLDKIAQMRHKE